MADVRPHAPMPGAPTPDPRATRNAWKQARLEAIRKSMEIPRVRVTPANEDIRRVLRHPHGMPFRETGSVEWPLDKFTQKRINDGSITAEPVDKPARADKPAHAAHQEA